MMCKYQLALDKARASALSEVISALVPSTGMYDIITTFLLLTDFKETFFLNI